MDLHVKSFTSGLFAGCLAYGLAKWIQEKRKKNVEIKSLLISPKIGSWNDCSRSSTLCELLGCPDCNYSRFLNVIKNTKSHLDICVYLITLGNLTETIIKLFKRGVFVRIITDKDISSQAPCNKNLVFMKEHIPIKLVHFGELMHNKFAIIDGEILVIGSFNWTKQAFTQNFESGVVISNHKIIQQFGDYFQGIWLSF